MGSGSGSDASPPPAPTPSKPAHSVAEFEEAIVAGLFTGRKPTNSKLTFSNVTQSASPLIDATVHMNRDVSDTVTGGTNSSRISKTCFESVALPLTVRLYTSAEYTPSNRAYNVTYRSTP